MKKSELKKFGILINKELIGISKQILTDNQRIYRIMGIKDTVYLLGVTISPLYKCYEGFNIFSQNCGIDWNIK